MVLTTLKLIDWLIIAIVLLAFIVAIISIINNKKKGNSIGCSNCPFLDKCHNIKECNKYQKKDKE